MPRKVLQARYEAQGQAQRSEAGSGAHGCDARRPAIARSASAAPDAPPRCTPARVSHLLQLRLLQPPQSANVCVLLWPDVVLGASCVECGEMGIHPGS